MKADRPAGKKPWKLWHLAVVVLLAAPAFGAIRVMAVGPDGPAELALVALVTISACVGASVALLRAGRGAVGRATAGLKRWGVDRDGVDGFLAWLLGIGVEVGFALAAILIASVAVVTLLAWLARLAGR